MTIGGRAAISAAAFASLTVRVVASRRQAASRRSAPVLGPDRPPPVVAVARVVTLLGSRPVVYAVAAAADVIAVRDRDRPPRALVLVSSGMIIRGRVADLVARPRPSPDRWLVNPNGHSYPSRHTTAAALGFGVLARSVRLENRRTVRLAAAAVTAAVGASRVYLGVHWVSDVIGGWLLAETWLTAAEQLDPGPRDQRDGAGPPEPRQSRQRVPTGLGRSAFDARR